MLLREFLYYKDDSANMIDDLRYDIDHDISPLESKDLRKSRLTLKMINFLRKASEAREIEHEEDLELIKKMYANPVEGTI